MAEKKETPRDPVVDVGFILVVAIFLVLLWSAILNYLLIARFGSYANIWQSIVDWFLTYIWPIIIVLSVIISILCIIGIRYNYKRLRKLQEEEKKIFGASVVLTQPIELPKNDRWEEVQKHAGSQNPSDWRLAIIEADVMLDELLRAQGYHGDSIGDMLKGVERSDMTTLDFAWEAHKVRNELVHSGTSYELNDREARRIISLYEAVFREFKII